MLGTRLVAGVTGTMNIVVGCLYLGPSQLVRRPLPPDQISLVVYVESFGPWWVLMFVLSGIWLLVTSIRKRGFLLAHSGSVFIWGFYGLAILLGAMFSEPPTPILAGAIATFMALLHSALAFSCAERGYR
ncbi:membrane protein [Gordonia phage Hibiscus]|uniref:Membrane protein n=1 Tax=Gordonia phage Santhid TaxID=2927281 RepID=A0AAE9KE77_9CAUD|nr:membrane protein [Gordonia phage Santhid]UOK18019.1 membrane protein [Gordonia phage Santhid]